MQPSTSPTHGEHGPSPDSTPSRIGAFRVVRRLASGSTSDIYLASGEGPDSASHAVVLKVLFQRVGEEPTLEQAFRHESSAYAHLAHPAIVKLHEFFVADGQPVLVLEYVDGLPLNKVRAMLGIAGDKMDDAAALFAGIAIFSALTAAHGAKDPVSGAPAPMIHRDINPSNVLIGWDGQVKLADFGVATLTMLHGDTKSGFIKGTYGYLAPEQVRGEPVTARADVYAGALLLWELLAHRKAIQRGALPEAEVLKAMAMPDLPSLDSLRPDLHGPVRAVIRRALEPNADLRTIGADEIVAVLRAALPSATGHAEMVATMARVRPAMPTVFPSGTEGDALLSSAQAAHESTTVAAHPVLRLPDVEETVRVDPDSPMYEGLVDMSRRARGGHVDSPPSVDAAGPPSTDEEPIPPPPLTLPLPLSSDPDASGSGVGFVRTTPKGAQSKTLRIGLGGTLPSHAPVADMPTRRPSPPPRPAMNATGPAAFARTLSSPMTSPAAAPAAGTASAANAAPSPQAAAQTFPFPSPLDPPPPPPMTPFAAVSQTLAMHRVPPHPAVPPPVPPSAVDVPPGEEPTRRLSPFPGPLNPPPGEIHAALAPSVPVPTPAAAPVSTSPPAPVRRGPWAALGFLAFAGGALALYFAVFHAAPHASPPMTSSPIAAETPVPAPATSAAALAASPAPSPSPSAVASATTAALHSATPPSAASSSPAAVAPPPSALAVTPATPPSPSSATAPSPKATTTGDIVAPKEATGHRVFMDGHVVGEGAGTFHVACGKHTIRIGSSGTPRPVDVPCGATLTL